MKNQYFKIVKFKRDKYKLLTCIHIKQDIDVWKSINEKYFNTDEYFNKFHNDPYNFIFYTDLKKYIKSDHKLVYDLIKNTLAFESHTNIENEDIKVFLATSDDYRQIDEQFDNEMNFLEHILSEVSHGDKYRNITEDILKENGFENTTKDWELDHYKKEFYIDDYSSWHYSTNKEDGNNYIIIDFQKGITNSFAIWNIHLDNNVCCSIGNAEISTVWQFNTLMQIYGSKFRLK